MTATQTDRNPKPRAALSRERVLRAALVHADKGGIESLSMRNLGQELGVKAMSLYNHVANKDDVLDGLVDIVLGEIEMPAIGSQWKPAIRRRAMSAREVLSRHPWAAGVIESRTRPGPATLQYHDSVLGILRKGGFSVDMAAHAFSLIDSFIFGFGVQETSMPVGTQVANEFRRRLRDDIYPYLAEMTEYVITTGYDHSDEFEFGLDLILDGLEKARDGAPRASKRTSVASLSRRRTDKRSS